MNTPIKFKVCTIIANSETDEAQKKVLETYIDTLSDGNLAKLITVFEKYPKSVAVYADYIKKLNEQSQPVSSEKLEEIISPLLSKLS